MVSTAIESTHAISEAGLPNPGAKPDDKDSALLSGHLGHLSEQQEEALNEFRSLIVAEDDEDSSRTPKTENPLYNDTTFLRFLRARKFDVPAAVAQFKQSESWRKSNKIGALYEHFDVAKFENAKRYYPQWTGRRDKQGFPLYVYDLSSKGIASFARDIASTFDSSSYTSTASPQLQELFALSEYVFRFVQPLCSSMPDRPHVERPITSTTNLIDLSGVGLKQFWNLKSHLQQASVLANTHYPEAVERIFVIGAPAIVPFFWNLIKNWFDPVTTAKIFILSSSQVLPTLTKHVDPSNLPRKYGGKLDWEFGMSSKLDEQTEQMFWGSEQTRALVEGPILWERDGVMQKPRAVAVGTIDGHDRRRIIGTETDTNGI